MLARLIVFIAKNDCGSVDLINHAISILNCKSFFFLLISKFFSWNNMLFYATMNSLTRIKENVNWCRNVLWIALHESIGLSCCVRVRWWEQPIFMSLTVDLRESSSNRTALCTTLTSGIHQPSTFKIIQLEWRIVYSFVLFSVQMQIERRLFRILFCKLMAKTSVAHVWVWFAHIAQRMCEIRIL